MRSLAAIAVALIAGTLTASPASAETRSFRDDDRAGGPTGVTSFRVQNGPNALTVDIRHARRLKTDDLWIDSRGGDPGPEYRVRLIANSDYDKPLRRVETFHTGNGRPWPCQGTTLHSDDFEPGAVSHIRIPQDCISGAGRVRVHVDSYGNGTGRDHAPNRGAYGAGYWTPWVRQR